MTPYVFIGFSGSFGEYTDIVHACGGYVRKVVINMPTDIPLGPMNFHQRLAHYERYLHSMGVTDTVEVQQLRDFQPDSADRHVLAARGLRLQPLQRYMTHDLGLRLHPLVHPSVILSPTVVVPDGIVIRAGACIGSAVVLGAYAAVGSLSYVGHDSHLEEYSTVNPGARLASGTRLGKGAVVGLGATVINECTIGEEAFVAAGAVVTQNVPPLTLVAGVPAVVKKQLTPSQIPTSVPGLESQPR